MRIFILVSFLLVSFSALTLAEGPSIPAKSDLESRFDQVYATQLEILRQVNEIAQGVQTVKTTVTARPR